MTKTELRTSLLRGSILALGALALAPAAYAEEDAQQSANEGQQASVQEIIVTAQRRDRKSVV